MTQVGQRDVGNASEKLLGNPVYLQESVVDVFFLKQQ